MDRTKIKVIEGQVLRGLYEEVIGKGQGKFGIRGADNTGVVLHQKMLERHILTLGSIGSGKTNLMNHIIDGIRRNATEEDMFIFFDAKGDYYEHFYQDGDMVICNDVKPILGSVNWNIFEEIKMTHPQKREEFIRELATSFFKHDIEKSSSPIFAVGAKDLFAAIVTALMWNSEDSGEYWDHERFIKYIQEMTDVTIRNLLMPCRELRWVRQYVPKDNPSIAQSYLVHLYQTVYQLFSGNFTKAGNFSIRRAIQEKNSRAVFLEYDLGAGYLLEPIYTALIDIAMKEVLGRSRPGGRVFFILDEFPLIPKLNYMDNALNFGRSLGVRVVAGIQNIGQVEYRYGESMGRSLLSGFGTVFGFRLFDEASRRFIADRHGRNKKLQHIFSSNADKGVQDQVVEGMVIEDWDIASLSIGECILSLPNGEPYLFYPIEYK